MKVSSKYFGKPFIKWAGGKTQLLNDIEKQIPTEFREKKFTYIEPFLGGGALLFHILKNYSNVEKVVANDINADLIGTYKSIKTNLGELLELLEILQNEYYSLLDYEDKKKEYFYNKRTLFNQRTLTQVEQSALFIFLNKTCFNGLFRVNKKNQFNVPIGSYKKPLICDKDNLSNVHRLLQKVIFLNGDFEETLNYTSSHTLFYFDPPYKPLTQTSNFNSYTKGEFNDDEQSRLAQFCKLLDRLGHTWILSNSDVQSENSDISFFEELYGEFTISKVSAKRSINSNPTKRGQLSELLITNNKTIYAKDTI